MNLSKLRASQWVWNQNEKNFSRSGDGTTEFSSRSQRVALFRFKGGFEPMFCLILICGGLYYFDLLCPRSRLIILSMEMHCNPVPQIARDFNFK